MELAQSHSISINGAYALEIQNPLVTVIEQLQEQTRSVNKYISSTISQKLDDLSESLARGFTSSSLGSYWCIRFTRCIEKLERKLRLGHLIVTMQSIVLIKQLMKLTASAARSN